MNFLGDLNNTLCLVYLAVRKLQSHTSQRSLQQHKVNGLISAMIMTVSSGKLL